MNDSKVKLNGTIIQGPPLRYTKTPNLIIGEDNGYERGDILDANMVAELVKEGGGGSTSQMLGYVNPSMTSLPTTRIDGTPAEKEDYVKPESNSAFPFTIDGITFSTRLDRAIYLGDGRWMLDAGIIQQTNETPITNEALESLTGSAVFQSDANKQFATTIGKSETIDVDDKETLISAVNHIWKELVSLEGKILKFKGFISTTTPTGTIKDGSLWYESATLPTTFPINVKTYNATTSQWSTTTSQYTPEALDLWSNLNDDKGYYWFGNAWNIIDDSGKFVYVSTFTGVVGNPSVLYYLDTAYSTYEKGFYRFIPASGGTPEKFVLLNKELFKYVSTFTGETGDIDRLYFLDTQYDNYTIGFYRFIQAQGTEPAKFVRINPSPIQYVTTFTGVTGNTEYLYYLLTEYDNYEVGFYRFVKATGTEPEKFVHLNKVRFKYVSTFTGEIGDINRLYYLDTAYDDYKVGFYRYNGINFININPKHFFIVSTFTGVDGDNESLYYLDTAYDTYKVGFYRFIPTEGAEPAKFVLIGRSLVKYVSTFTNVDGDTDALYYLDTDYISATNKYYPEGFYRYIEREQGGVTVGEFVLINHNQVVYLPTFTDVTGNVEKLYYLYNDTASYFKGFYRFDPINGDFVPLNETGIVYLSTFTGVVGKPNFLYFLDTEYDNYKKGFYKFVKEGSDPGRFVLFEPLDKEYVQYVSTFENLEDPDTEVLYYLDTAYTTATKAYKVGFYRYVEEVEEEVVVSSEFVLIGAASEVFTDVEELPTEDISDATIYRLKVFKYYHNGEEIEKPTGYKSLDTSVLIATPDYLEHHVSEEEIVQYVWGDVTDAILGQLSSLLEASTFEESDFLTLGENTYCHKTSVIEEITYELYHNPTKIALGYLPVCEKGLNIELDEVTTEFVDDKLQANAIIDVDTLPTTGIKSKTIYRMFVDRYYEDGNLLASVPTGYLSIRPAIVIIDENGITDNGTFYAWADITDDQMDFWVIRRQISQVYAADLMTMSTCFKTASNHYVYKDHVTNEQVYELYHNPTGVEDEYVKIGGAEGGSADVEIDNATIIKVNDKLQANAIIEVDVLSTSNIKEKSIYKIVDKVPQYTDSETIYHDMTKYYYREDGNWVNHSIVNLTQDLYDNLSTEQKTDGTIYVVDDNTPVIQGFTYNELANKPSINGITLQDALSLEDLSLYSRSEVNSLLENKGQVEFVSQLPATPTTNTWYYSTKFEDGTTVPNDKRALYIVDEDITQYHYMGVVGDIEMETGDTLSGSEHLVTSSQVVKKEMSTKLNKYGTQVDIETAVNDATLWTNLAQIGTDDKKTDSSMVFNAGTCYLIGSVSPTNTAQIYQFIVTGSAGASAINKKITLINPLTNEIFTKSMDSGTWQAWKGGKKYKHTLVRYNNDSFEYPMGWVSIISNKKTMSVNDFKTWLNEKGYTTATNSYYWCGGCCGTTEVRNSADTGKAYVGKVVSGVFYDGTNLFFKWDYNGTTQINPARCKIVTEELN